MNRTHDRFRRRRGRLPHLSHPRRDPHEAGTILAFAEGRKSSRGDSGDIDLLVKRSTDGGKRFGDAKIVWDDGDKTVWQPVRGRRPGERKNHPADDPQPRHRQGARADDRHIDGRRARPG